MTTSQLPAVVFSEVPPWWAEFVEVLVEIGVGTGIPPDVRALWDRTLWDNGSTGEWSELEPEWTPVDPCRLRSFKVTRGRDRAVDRFPSSSCSITIDDPDGSLSWDQDVDDADLEIRPGRQIRIRARHVSSGETFPVWRGWIESIADGFAPGYPPPAVFTCQDLLAQVAHVNLPEQEPVGAGETSDERVARLLALAAVPENWQDRQSGRITVQATNLARNLADDLGVTADSEGGAVYVDRDGIVCFRNRDWLRVDPLATEVQATIGGTGADVCGSGYELVRDAGDIVNDVQVARAGGTMQRATDETSIARYRRRTWARSDYVMETDDQAMLLAKRILAARSSGNVRMNEVQIVPNVDDATWKFCLAVDYGWRVRVLYESPFDPSVSWARDVIVQGIDVDATPDGWSFVLKVDDAGPAGLVDTWDGPDGWDRALWSERI